MISNIWILAAIQDTGTDLYRFFTFYIKLHNGVVTLLLNQMGLNSSNSSKPPSTDPNCDKKKKKPSDKKAGGQNRQ
jgi:uncharacterized protein DUF6444